jgi:pyruvyl transferase EpsO
MHFFDQNNLHEFAQVAAEHKDLHLLWRDRDSYDLAQQHFECNNYLVPDMAHFLWPLTIGGELEKPSGDLFLIRRDEEAGPIPAWIAARESEFVDWRDLIPFPHRQIRRLLTISDVIGGAAGLDARTLEAWSAFCFRLLPRLAQIFGRHERIITSRLHGHIFACLLARHSVLLDNSYGKNTRYFRTWTHNLSIADLDGKEICR